MTLIDLQFSINKAESDLTGTLAIELSKPLTLEAIRQAALFKELLQLLYNQEISYQAKQRQRKFIGSNTPLSLFHVSCLSTTRALELLADTHAFYFNGKKLICDFHSHLEFYYLITPDGDQVNISGQLKTATQEIKLSECSFICSGTHNYCIHGLSLRPIITEIAWKDLKQLYFSADQVKLSHLQKNYGDEEESPLQPKLIFKETSEKIASEIAGPLPLLRLTDRLGAFANLWMAYSQENGEESLLIAYHDHSPWVKDKRHKPLLKRQLDCEKGWEKDLLETDFIKKMDSNSHYYCPVDCVAKSLSFLLDIGWQLEDYQGRKICRLTESSMQINTVGEAFVIKGKIKYEEHAADLKDIVGAFNRKDRFVQIGSNQVGLLPSGPEHSNLCELAGEGEIIQEGIKLKRSSLGIIADFLNSNTSICYDETLANLKEKLAGFTGVKEAQPSEKFKGKLRPYQQEGVNWLSFLYEYGFHGLLADDMGLGKTVQVLAFLSRLKSELPILVILPTSLIFNWKHEIEQFLPEMPIHVYQGAQRAPWKENSGAIILTSYATLRIDLPLFQNQLFECILLDEAQTIKNAHTQTAQAAYSLRGKFRLSLTGTPIENHIHELWSHFRFLIPDLFGEERVFLSEVAAGAADFRFLEKIRQKMRPFLLRRKKEEVAQDLPERIEQVVYVQMDPMQRKCYDDFLSGYRSNLLKKIELEGIGKHRMEVLEALLRLRQICCHPLLISNQEEEIATACSAKMEALLQDMETAIEENRKVLVYSQFTSMLSLIAKEARERNWKFVYLDGQTKDREHVVNTFQNDPETLLFLISLKAGGIGLNLTAADYVFLYDPWWNEAVENQAIDRAHRIGRKDTVIAKRYVTVETVEEKMMTLKASKRSLLSDILHDQQPVEQLSIEDLRYLFD